MFQARPSRYCAISANHCCVYFAKTANYVNVLLNVIITTKCDDYWWHGVHETLSCLLFSHVYVVSMKAGPGSDLRPDLILIWKKNKLILFNRTSYCLGSDDDNDDDDDDVSAAGARLHAGRTAPVSSWPILSIRAWTTVWETVRHWWTSRRLSVAMDSLSLARSVTADLTR